MSSLDWLLNPLPYDRVLPQVRLSCSVLIPDGLQRLGPLHDQVGLVGLLIAWEATLVFRSYLKRSPIRDRQMM